MDIYQAAYLYNAQFKGFNSETGMPTAQMENTAMESVVQLAANNEMPTDGKLRHLDEVVGLVSVMSPQSASIFNRQIIENPQQRQFAKSLETAFAIMEERSPETWQHVKHHAALTMLYYENEIGKNKAVDLPNIKEMLTLFVGALGHDIGKIGLDPELLHKDTRVSRKRFSEVLDNYRKIVPAYPEKLHDTIFLEEANAGRILFAEKQNSVPTTASNATITDLGKDMRRSETYWTNDEERKKYNEIFERINAHAKASIVTQDPAAWLNEKEQAALLLPRRGTVTPEERRIIESHDNMSEAFFKAATMSPDLEGVRDIVSMDKFRPGNNPTSPLLGDIIHTTDVFESITGNRSYRKPYTLEEATKVLEGMAKDGKKAMDGQINGAIVQSLKSSGTLEQYAAAAGLQHSKDITIDAAQLIPAQEEQQNWVKRVGGPSRSQGFRKIIEMGNRDGISIRA